jgi:putative FmdB family regulatory protein
MPVYVYCCAKCGDFEIISPMPGKAKEPCPKCGKESSRRIARVNHSFGWRLSDESHLKGHKDELVRDI